MELNRIIAYKLRSTSQHLATRRSMIKIFFAQRKFIYHEGRGWRHSLRYFLCCPDARAELVHGFHKSVPSVPFQWVNCFPLPLPATSIFSNASLIYHSVCRTLMGWVIGMPCEEEQNYIFGNPECDEAPDKPRRKAYPSLNQGQH